MRHVAASGAKATLGTMAVGFMTACLANPEMLDKLVTSLQHLHFSERLIALIEKMHTSKGQEPLAVIQTRCDAMQELINTRAAELADDAPIEAWHAELNKIQRGVEMLQKDPVQDRKKIKALQQRSKKLWDSAFRAAAE
ncbi:hypothetical protein Tam1G_2196 [Bifidobacterium imperatoris]|uniref:Uncharacterized protein n=2 Tax=Bifidobacterium imperatoris TaxID=2020965 RepID=A0A2N5IP70_9BIFI|nr:hypothetical protein Tam1G_2196 [Bifidobacterium imperatoris]